MKKSIAYSPKNRQKDLNFLMEQIKERLPQVVMVILYGSYARNEYVDHDERDEHGIPTIKISDYDILVVTSGIGDKRAGTVLDNIEDMYFRGKNVDMHTPVQFINDDIETLNTALGEGRYFYTQIKEEGVICFTTAASSSWPANASSIMRRSGNRRRSILRRSSKEEIVF